MTEVQGAVLVGELRKLDRNRGHPRHDRKTVWSMLKGLLGLGFRELPDRDSDLATHLVVILPDTETGMLPATDALLARSMSLAIGVVDPNLAPFGLSLPDDAEVACQRAQRIIDGYREVTL